MMSSSGVNLQNYQIPLQEIICATENFNEKRCIGRGGFGTVYEGQLSKHWQNRIAAFKRLGQERHVGKGEFHNELDIICRIHHENIISFIGYCDEGDEMIIVYEYASEGSLDDLLQDPNRMSGITWTQRLMICMGAARGLDYLHSGLGEHNRVIHRDIKSANILLDGNFVAKICDFGLSKLGPRNRPDTELYTKVAGTPFYLDPTYHESSILRKESDMYSFGVVLFEILSGMLAYHERRIGDKRHILMTLVRQCQQQEPEKVIDPNIRDQIRGRSLDTFMEIAYQCISLDFKERPMLDTVIKKIEEAFTIQVSELSASNPADRSMIEGLLRKLNSDNPDDQRTASGEIYILTERNTKNFIAFGEAGAFPLLKRLLTAPDPLTQEHAMAALFNLSIYEAGKGGEGSITSSGAVPGIVHVLRKGSMVAREKAASIIYFLSNSGENNKILGSAGAIPPLVLLLNKAGSERLKQITTLSLIRLCQDHRNKGRAVRTGIVPKLTKLLTEPDAVLKSQALLNLALLSSHPEGRLAIGEAVALPVLVEILGTENPQNRELAARILVELCSHDQKYLVEAQELGAVGRLMDQKYLLEAQELGVMGRLIDLFNDDTDTGKDKAGQLLEMITRLNELQL